MYIKHDSEYWLRNQGFCVLFYAKNEVTVEAIIGRGVTGGVGRRVCYGWRKRREMES